MQRLDQAKLGPKYSKQDRYRWARAIKAAGAYLLEANVLPLEACEKHS